MTQKGTFRLLEVQMGNYDINSICGDFYRMCKYAPALAESHEEPPPSNTYQSDEHNHG